MKTTKQYFEAIEKKKKMFVAANIWRKTTYLFDTIKEGMTCKIRSGRSCFGEKKKRNLHVLSNASISETEGVRSICASTSDINDIKRGPPLRYLPKD